MPAEGPAGAVAFLLSQLGFESSRQFGDRLVPLGLEARHAGLLRQLAGREGCSQQALAEALGVVPSRVVALVDELEARGLVERRLNPTDRRARALFLTANGRRVLEQVAETGRALEAALTKGLSAAERQQLVRLLSKLADDQGLAPGVHPGLAARD
ncbi:MAG: MarR family transcriptional regulator [Acidobacteria bacterium]|nr:MarR family transcriptional regulator [Acidobacteriota bacterium]